MRLLIAGSTALLLLAACQGRTANRPGANVETGATGSDSMVTQPQPTTTDSSAIPHDTAAKTDTSSKGAVGKDTAKKP